MRQQKFDPARGPGASHHRKERECEGKQPDRSHRDGERRRGYPGALGGLIDEHDLTRQRKHACSEDHGLPDVKTDVASQRPEADIGNGHDENGNGECRRTSVQKHSPFSRIRPVVIRLAVLPCPQLAIRLLRG